MNDEYYMSLALQEAQKAYEADEVPIGCVIVNNNQVLTSTHNHCQQTGDPCAHAELVAALKPGQKTFLVPGPAFGHKPEPWLAYAHSNPDQVVAIIPFIWFDDPNHKDVNYTGLEAASEELRQAWINAGKSCVAK